MVKVGMVYESTSKDGSLGFKPGVTGTGVNTRSGSPMDITLDGWNHGWDAQRN